MAIIRTLRLGHITDLHLCPNGRIPQSRTNTYQHDVWEELNTLRTDLISQGIDALCISGDIFHYKTPSRYNPEDLNRISEWLNSLPFPIYSIPGNHDLPQSSIDNLSKSPYLTVLNSVQNMRDVSDNETPQLRSFLQNICITGIPYMPLDRMRENLEKLNSRLNPENMNIILLHCDAIPNADIKLPYKVISQSDMVNMIPNADVILQGHIHLSFAPVNIGNTLVSKPWSIGRVVKDYFNNTDVLEHQHIPTYGICDIGYDEETKAKIKYVQYYPLSSYKQAAEIFDFNLMKKEISNSVAVQSFVDKLNNEYGNIHNAMQLQGAERFMGNLSEDIRKTIQEYLDKV